jgi:succinate dehydrogenase hydrophobic anchor subunit
MNISSAKRFLIKFSPYLMAFLSGLVFFFLATKNKTSFHDLLINISAAFFAIPLLYFFYDLVKTYSQKKLQKVIMEYAKIQIDTEVLSILNQLYKVVFSIGENEFTFSSINSFLKIKKNDLKKALIEKEFYGFQIFKSWGSIENNLCNTLKNPFILESLENEHKIIIIELLTSINYLVFMNKNDDLYLPTSNKAIGYKIIKGTDINKSNQTYPDRYIFLKQLPKGILQVMDFGDIPKYNYNKCLDCYRINQKYVQIFCDAIFLIISHINKWLALTGYEFILDEKMFKVYSSKKYTRNE